jgi:hypothetical protein
MLTASPPRKFGLATLCFQQVDGFVLNGRFEGFMDVMSP